MKNISENQLLSTRLLLRIGLSLAVCLLLSAAATQAQSSPPTQNTALRLPAIISDNMVVQAGVELPFWGWDAPGVEVAVSFEGRRVSAVAGTDGRWHVRLPPFNSGGPYQIVVKGSSEVKINNVLAGEVWL